LFFFAHEKKRTPKNRIGQWSNQESSVVLAAGVRSMGELCNQARSIFLEAIEKYPPEQWPAFLDGACGAEAPLRARVEELLRAQVQLGSFHEAPQPAVDAPTGEAATEHPGGMIGPYKLLEQIGEGGMGVVYKAEQQEPVRRLVALKVIKAGMDSAQVIARFEAERQALALMDDPHIARVFDAGTTAQNRPYFVMELVKGTPITKYCDEHRLTLRQRLDLFVPVCQALQHAHQKGIIHRDVKPSNVLVAPYDGRPVIKVIDFGVAKGTGQPLTARTLFTALGAVVGTLEYMSPEQAELNNQDIDTRSDIYSLGVLLYELLTGTTPLTKQRLRQDALIEMLRRIREEEPPRPSTRLSESRDSLPAVAAQRQLEPAQLTRLVRGELDWIVMKALEKERGRRYETAGGLARDLQRYLADEAVEACPPSAGYKVRRLARQYRHALAVVAAFALLLVAGAVVSGWQAVRAIRAEAEARAAQAQAESERDRAQTAEQLASVRLVQVTRQKDRAEKAEQSAAAALAAEAEAKKAAQAAAVEAKYRLTRLHIATGAQALERGEPSTALLWHVRAWERDRDGAMEQDHRVRVGSAAAGFPRLTGVCFHPTALADAALDAAGTRVLTCAVDASGTRQSQIDIWDHHASRLAVPPLTHGAPIRWAAFSPMGGRVATASDDQTAAVWDADTGKRLFSLAHPGRVLSIAFRPDGAMLATAGDGKELRLWDTATGQPAGPTFNPPADLVFVGFAPDGRRLVTADRVNHAQVWDVESGEQIGPAVDHVVIKPSEEEHYRTYPVLSPDGTQVLTNSATAPTLWHVPGSDPIPLAARRATSFHFSQDGKMAVIANGSSLTSLLDLSEKKSVAWFNHPRRAYEATLSPDGQRLATTSSGGLVTVWDAMSITQLFTLRCGGQVERLRFSVDGRLLLAAGRDGTDRIWDVRTGDMLVAAEADAAGACWFGQDGRTVQFATGKALKRLRLPAFPGSVEDAQCLARLLTGQFLDETDGVEFIPATEFIQNRSAYRKAWLVWNGLPDTPPATPSD
jgi:serine/threonine protein kinase